MDAANLVEKPIMRRRYVLAVIPVLFLAAVSGVRAQKADDQPATVLPGRPDEKTVLGDWFESRLAGISLQAPAGSKEIRKPGVADHIVEFVNEQRGWVVRVQKMELEEGRPLGEYVENDKRREGVLQATANLFKDSNPTAEQLRLDIDKIGKYPMGLMVFRYSQQTAKRLFQEALIPVDSKFYYVISMQSPGRKGGGNEVDPEEKLAVDTFRAVLESVQLNDRTEVKKEQDDRLVRTRTLLLQLKRPGTLEKVLIPEQFLRLVQDGKDVGYSYVSETKTRLDGRDGVMIAMRSHTAPASETEVDVLSRMFVSQDWMYESWTHNATARRGKETQVSGELGLSNVVEKRMLRPELGPGERLRDGSEDKNQPPMVTEQHYMIEVRKQAGRAVEKPFNVELPPWYIAQAAKHLFPRLLASDNGKTYLVASYVSEHHQVMGHYIDVGVERELTFGGQKITATPVVDKVGFEGVPTTYYVGPGGKYYGSETTYLNNGKRTTIQLIPSDERTLRGIWPKADLSAPTAADLPAAPRSAAPANP
jgi:hypothetical protein